VPLTSRATTVVVLQGWDLNGILTSVQIKTALEDLMAWPLRVTQIRGLFADAWKLRGTLTLSRTRFTSPSPTI